ncbi:MAG: ATP-binding cassette domain-containing protein [Bacteroidales bacterium]|nr:ATP-binding cassette domain-containing protein [Bacteroidales bacterium]
MISVNNLSIHFTGSDLFSNVSFLINNRDRIGLVGKNGSGKTTLLNIIAGKLVPQQGEVIIPTGTRTGYLEQEMDTGSRVSIFQEALTAFSETRKLEKKIQKLTGEISRRTDYESDEYHQLIQKLTEANDLYHLIGGQSMEGETEKVLLGLGFKRTDFERPVSEFSSGWQMRLELAKILLQKPEVILLDEPTNHLDIESIQWLEEFLKGYYGAVILVSHDRAFLDNVTERTIEISFGKVYDYKASYSGYVQMREERLERQVATYNNQQKQIRQIEKFIERFRYKNTKARQVQSKIKMLDKIDKVEFDEIDESGIHFSFPSAPRSGKVVVEGINLSKKYDDFLVLQDLNFAIIKGDRVAFVGRNGEGKSTLSKILAGELDYSGTLKLGHNLQTGYYAQDQANYLNPNKTVFETIDDIATGDIRRQIRTILGSFLFSGDTIDKKVKVLSGGEKSRLSLAKLLLTPSNLLILDEPTNHLDMQSKDVLKNALLSFDGSLIVVSHDRDFLEGLTNKVFEFRDLKIKEYLGDIYDFMEAKKMNTLQELEKNREKQTFEANQISGNKLGYERKKQLEKVIRKLNTQITRSEEKIRELEAEIARHNGLLSSPNESLDFDELSKNYEKFKKMLELEMNNWSDLQEEKENLKNEF